MPSTPTPRLRVMQQARGENLNAWGDPNLNNALARLEEGQAKVLTLAITGDYTLTVQNYLEDEARSAALVLTGTPSAAFKITIPAAEKPYIVINTTGQIATVGTAGGVGAQVRAGLMNTVVCNGTDTRIVDPTLDQIRKAMATVDLNGQKLVNAATASADGDVPNFGQIKSSVQTAVSAAGTATTAKDTAVTAKNDAVTAKDAAVAARTATEAVYDAFDDRYLGAKSVLPTVDNDGNALLTGALVFLTSNNTMMVWNGSVWQVQAPNAQDYVAIAQKASKSAAEAGSNDTFWMTPLRTRDAIIALSGLFHARDEKASGTAGGTPVAASWNIRTLNTILTNDIGASLASNAVTLSDGVYYVEASAPAIGSGSHQLRLYNLTDNIAALTGTSGVSAGGASTSTLSIITGRLSVVGQKQFRIEHYLVSASGGAGGLGAATGSAADTPAIYANLLIWKVR